MNLPPILQRHRALRWLAPAGVVCVAGLAATGMFTANASSESLPQTTPAALVAAVQSSDVEGFSGTVVSRLSLGLPDLPAIGQAGDGTSLTSLLTGSHTMQVWYGGFDKQRVALLGSTDETDVFRNGRDVWQWSSADHVAVHARLPKAAAQSKHPAPPISSAAPSLTPSALAHQAIEALDPSTKVAVDSGRVVADRSTYELVLTPRTQATKIAAVHIAVDGDTKVPLGVQIFARGSAAPAVDVAFTSIRFAPQTDRNFEFSPPPDATVRQLRADPDSVPSEPDRPTADARPTTTGSGWTTVVGVHPGTAQLAKVTKGAVGKALTPVSGAWGQGRLLDSALVSVLVTDDGWVFAGAVEPAQLYAAAGSK